MSSDGTTTRADGLPRGGYLSLPDVCATDSDLLRGAGDGPPAGSGGDQGALARATVVRFPDLRGKPGRERVELLIDHINDTAFHRGELEELRLAAHVNLLDAQKRLKRVPTAISKTRSAADEARRASAPAVAEQVDGAKWLIDRCAEQINRLDRDYDAASRAYTLLSGS